MTFLLCSLQHYIMKNFKLRAKLEELYREHPDTHHLGSMINRFLKFALSPIFPFFHSSIDPSRHLSWGWGGLGRCLSQVFSIRTYEVSFHYTCSTFFFFPWPQWSAQTYEVHAKVRPQTHNCHNIASLRPDGTKWGPINLEVTYIQI